MSERKLLLAMLVGVVVGGLLGWWAPPIASSIAWIGDIFLDALKALVLPLIFCSMIIAVTNIVDASRLKRLASLAGAYYVFTTLVAVFIGLMVVNVIQPGVGAVPPEGGVRPDVAATSVTSVLRSIVTPNLFAAAANFQVLPVLVFALAFGTALISIGERGRPAVDFFSACNDAVMKLVDWLMYAAPVGIAALVAGRIALAGGGEGILAELRSVGLYALAVLVGLGIHGFVVLPLILRTMAGRSPVEYIRNLGEAVVTAFGTGSSSATLPLTMRLTVERNKVRFDTAGFVLPLGATVNMDGTALYEAVAALYIAQVYGVELGLGSQFAVALAATLASIGAAGIPQAGLVTMVIVLETVGLPVEGISMILAIDWFLDRCRTAVNVLGDACGAGVVDARRLPTASP